MYSILYTSSTSMLGIEDGRDELHKLDKESFLVGCHVRGSHESKKGYHDRIYPNGSMHKVRFYPSRR